MAKDTSSTATIVPLRATPKISDEVLAWAKQRHINQATLEKLHVASGTVYFGEAEKKLPAIVFPYDEGWKARSVDGSKYFTSRKDTVATFWGIRDVLNGPKDRVYIVEGEMDRCALVETGIPQNVVLSCPGATTKKDPTTGEITFSGKLQYVVDAMAAGLAKTKRFVLCGDQDDQGLELRAALAQLLGVGKCEFVDWPEGIKDANDALKYDGKVELLDKLQNGALPWPAEGLFDIYDIPAPPKMTLWELGFDGWERRVHLAPGTLSLVIGQPGHGKTNLWGQIWQQVVQRYNLVACVATFETKPKPDYHRMLRQLYVHKNIDAMSDEEIRLADKWISNHYKFIIHREEKPTLEWLLGQAEIAITRFGAKIIVVDPWNRIEAVRETRESETDYIGRCLRLLYRFASDFGVHVQIMAHPSKRDGRRQGTIPELEDTSGSKLWETMIDQGFVVWRPQLYNDDGVPQTYCELHFKKCRFAHQLGHPAKFGLDFDRDQERYGTAALKVKKIKPTAASDAD